MHPAPTNRRPPPVACAPPAAPASRRPGVAGRLAWLVVTLVVGWASPAAAQPSPTGQQGSPGQLGPANASTPAVPPAQGPSLRRPLPPPPARRPAAEPLASPPRAATLGEALNARGDLTLRNSTLSGALFTIGELWGINIVSGQLDGNVNGVFKQAPLREILDSILLSNGYGYRAVGESLVVTELNRLGQVNPFFVSATIPVRAASVTDVVAGASLLTTPQGRVQAIPSARSVFVLDFPDRVKMIREFVASLDAAAGGVAVGGSAAPAVIGPRQLDVAYMKAHYVPAKTVGEVLTTVLSPLGKVTAMEDEDRLIVVDFAENLAAAQRVLERIDRPRPQVSIKSLIYDLSLTDIEQLGVNWSSITNGSLADLSISPGGELTGTSTPGSGAGTVLNSVTASPFTGGSAGGAFTFTSLGSNVSLAAVALMLQQADDSRLLASPAVTVAENERAIIQSVTEIPYQQLTQTAAGGAIGTTEFKQAGITLAVEPKIARDLTVEMVVRPEFSLLTGFTPGDNQPIIDRRTAETTVRVANGTTLVIGGMRQRSDVGSIAGIPFLKDVRVLGRLFRSRQTNIRESELVVFITPTIVGYDTPPSDRDQQAAETVRCQVAAIPPGAGCVAGRVCDEGAIEGVRGCTDGGCTDGFGEPGAATPEVGVPAPLPVGPIPPPPAPNAPTPAPPTPALQNPPPHNPAPQQARPVAPVPQPLVSSPMVADARRGATGRSPAARPRRLPPITRQDAPATAARPLQGGWPVEVLRR